MKTKLIIGVLVAAMVAGGAFFVLNKKDSETAETGVDSNSSASEENENSDSKSTNSDLNLPAQTVGAEADCSLYSLEEVAGVWGVPMTDTDINKVSELSTDGGKLYSCSYNETDSGMGTTVSLEYKEYVSEDAAKQSINDTRSGSKFDETVYFVLDEVESVGDEAFFSLPARMVDNPDNVEEQLYVRKGNLVILISAVNLDGVNATYRDKILETYKLHF